MADKTVKKPLKNITPKKKIELTYKQQKLLWGIIFLLPWMIGVTMLFAVPFFESLRYSFYELTPRAGEILKEFIGLDNYVYAFNEHVLEIRVLK